MNISRTWGCAVMLLLCGGIGGFAMVCVAARSPAAVADDAAKAGQADKPGQAAAAEAAPRKPQRFGSVIGLRPEKKDEYVRLHAACWPEIIALLRKHHIQNYSIYLSKLDGKLYLFSYFEYTGDDFAKDAAAMKADAKMRAWWKLTDPCQIRLPGTKEGDWWKRIPEVFRME